MSQQNFNRPGPPPGVFKVDSYFQQTHYESHTTVHPVPVGYPMQGGLRRCLIKTVVQTYTTVASTTSSNPFQPREHYDRYHPDVNREQHSDLRQRDINKGGVAPMDSTECSVPHGEVVRAGVPNVNSVQASSSGHKQNPYKKETCRTAKLNQAKRMHTSSSAKDEVLGRSKYKEAEHKRQGTSSVRA